MTTTKAIVSMETPSQISLINELSLQRFAQCPILVPNGPSKLEFCSFALMRWALRKFFQSSSMSNSFLSDLRGKFLDEFKKLSTDKAETEEAIKYCASIARRIFELVVEYEVLHPEQPYDLILGKYTIQGEYALIRKRNEGAKPYVLVLHNAAPTARYDAKLPPDFISLARYINVRNETQYRDIGILHYPVIRGKPWTIKYINETIAHDYLHGILKAMNNLPLFPSFGSHCAGCLTKPCMKVLIDNER